MFVAVAEFLDREHHASQRCVERRGDAGGAAGQQEARGFAWIGEAERRPIRYIRLGADVHGRPFAADRRAAQQGRARSGRACRPRRAATGCCARNRGSARFQRRDHLRDAAAAGGPQAPATSAMPAAAKTSGVSSSVHHGEKRQYPLEQRESRIAGTARTPARPAPPAIAPPHSTSAPLPVRSGQQWVEAGRVCLWRIGHRAHCRMRRAGAPVQNARMSDSRTLMHAHAGRLARPRHRQPAFARLPARDGRHGRTPDPSRGFVLDLARDHVPLRRALRSGHAACGGHAALRRDAGSRLHQRLRIPLPAPRARWPARMPIPRRCRRRWSPPRATPASA